MQIPNSYCSLKDRGLLSHEDFVRLDDSCLWLEGVRWLKVHGPTIELPNTSNMTPFAVSAYGDWWCWECEDASSICSSVILSPPDTGDCTWYAPSFEAFLFRRVLRFVSNDVFCDKPDIDEVRFTIREIHRQLEIWAEQLQPYLDRAWLDVILRLMKVNSFSTHIHSQKFGYQCLLLPHDAAEIEKALIWYPRLDKKFMFDRYLIDWYGE